MTLERFIQQHRNAYVSMQACTQHVLYQLLNGLTRVQFLLDVIKNDDTSDNDKYQMVVVCGKNKAAEDELLTHTWGKGVSVQVKGFVNNMDEWMRASDAIVTKAGPGTIAEASICGLPCMLSSFL